MPPKDTKRNNHTIVLKLLRYKNFLASGNYWTEINFEDARTQLVVGENGAGKSTFMDALCYVLYGKAYRDVNLPQLVNSINKKGMVVELIMEVRGKPYLIRRGRGPDVFEIHEIDADNNVKLVDKRTGVNEYQEFLEEQLLKRNHKTFCQSIVLGSTNYVPFMKLKAADRRAVVDDFLDIQICTVMNEVLKEQLKVLNVGAAKIGNEVSKLRGQLEVHTKWIADTKQISGDRITEKEGQWYEIHTRQIAQDERAQELLAKVYDLQEQLKAKEKVRGKVNQYNSLLDQLKAKSQELNREIDFYRNNEVCPTCRQAITSSFRENAIDELTLKTAKNEDAQVELLGYLEAAGRELEEYQRVNQEHQRLSRERAEAETASRHLKQQMDALAREMLKMKAALEMEAPTAEIEALQRDIEKQSTLLAQIEEDLSVANVAAGMLKDGGIKARIIRQYVPILNKLINQYLEELDLFCDFQFDENFNETLLSRYRDNFSYGSFSEGQKARINLAILFAWLEVIQARKSTSFNILVLDEILDGSLDYECLDACVKMFVRESSKRTIMVISPKPANWRNSFEKTLKFKLDKNFSRLEVSC